MRTILLLRLPRAVCEHIYKVREVPMKNDRVSQGLEGEIPHHPLVFMYFTLALHQQ